MSADQRNFHCWNYRRYIVILGAVSPSKEIHFSLTKIQENFSNYSAFHHRSVYIKDNLSNSPTEVLPEELALIENAIFTEPDDQSAWWYHQFLFTWIEKVISAAGAVETSRLLEPLPSNLNPPDYSWLLSIINQQLDMLQSLIEIEPDCKWALITRSSLLQKCVTCAEKIDNASAVLGVDMRGYIDTKLGESKELLSHLCVIDSAHKLRYEYLLSNIL